MVTRAADDRRAKDRFGREMVTLPETSIVWLGWSMFCLGLVVAFVIVEQWSRAGWCFALSAAFMALARRDVRRV